jgi:hypothetical protein
MAPARVRASVGGQLDVGWVPGVWLAARDDTYARRRELRRQPGQCYVRLPSADLGGSGVRLTDVMSGAQYERAARDLSSTGLHVDLPPWGYHVFEVKSV